MDPTGQHVVIGYNDVRGFNLDTPSISGFAYSDDGGVTFTDGGQLPNVATGTLGKTGPNLPQVYGDPDVKYVPGGSGCQFVYSSILIQGFGKAPLYTSVTQTLSIHRSRIADTPGKGHSKLPRPATPTGRS